MTKSKLVSNTKVYYPALDGLRFFAFFLVFLHHSLLNISSSNPFLGFFLVIIQKNGWVGVDLFFVLSGFLITTLLLKERKKFGRFSLKNFWIRRSLRIWPLYYLALFSGFFLIPYFGQNFFGVNFTAPKYENEIKNFFLYYVFFAGNWVVSLNGYSNFANISHLWTISVEEQFYFVWPILLQFIRNIKHAVFLGMIIFLASILTRFYLASQNVEHPGIYTNTLARIDTLTFGAVAALFIFYTKLTAKLKPLFSLKYGFCPFVLFSLVLYRIYLFDPKLKFYTVFGYSAVAIFMVFLVLFSISVKKNNFLTYKPFIFLGKISFGLYIWHILALDIAIPVFNKLYLPFFGVPAAFLSTVLLAMLSYYIYEIRFLKIKERFSKVVSRPVD